MDIRQTDPGGLRQRLSQVLAARPLLRGLLRALGAGGFCFVLAGAGLLDGPVPLALAPVCVLPFGPAAICAYLGAAAGYAVFWGLSAALEPVAAGFLLLAGSCLLADLVPDEQGWLASAAAGGIYALLGVIFVLRADGGLQAALQLILRLVLLTLSVRMLSPAPANARLRPYAAAVCLLAGLVRVQLPFGVPLAVIPAAAICVLAAAGPEALAVGAACGLVLDLGSVPSPPQTACFCFSLLACRLAAGRKLARAAVFSGMYFLCVLVWSGEHAGWTLGVLAGTLLACVLPPLPEHPAAEARAAAPDALDQAADVLLALEARVSPALPEPQTAPALIFDSAASAVCRSCVRQQLCWQERADETYRLLCGCAGTILRQGQAREGDLPPAFCSACIRAEAFREAVNQALRTQQAELLAFRRSEESRQIACALLGHLARFVGAAGRRPKAQGAPRWRLSLGVRAVGLRGDTLCGDAGACFQVRTLQYVLLCDGMGTGAGAKADAEEAISLLRAMITAGFAAPEAMALLNELYLLRGDGCFSTIDLLELDLCTAEGVLYKWGAAPSYLKKGGNVKKIGTASPPPGLGVGEEHRTGGVRLSLQRGELLVLTTCRRLRVSSTCAPAERCLRGSLPPGSSHAPASQSRMTGRPPPCSSSRSPCSLTISHGGRGMCRKRGPDPTFRKYFPTKHKIPARIEPVFVSFCLRAADPQANVPLATSPRPLSTPIAPSTAIRMITST